MNAISFYYFLWAALKILLNIFADCWRKTIRLDKLFTERLKGESVLLAISDLIAVILKVISFKTPFL